jgi:hypothetical protein
MNDGLRRFARLKKKQQRVVCENNQQKIILHFSLLICDLPFLRPARARRAPRIANEK